MNILRKNPQISAFLSHYKMSLPYQEAYDELHKKNVESAKTYVKSAWQMDVEHIIVAILFSLVVLMTLTTTFWVANSFVSLLAVGFALVGFGKLMGLNSPGGKKGVSYWYSIAWTVLVAIGVWFATSAIVDRSWWATAFLIFMAVVDLAFLGYEYWKLKQLSGMTLGICAVGDVLLIGLLGYALFLAQ